MLYALAFVKASRYRRNILIYLSENEKTPKELSIELNIHQNNISATLRGLKEYNLVYCINPNVKKGRLYKLTDKGYHLVKNLE